MCDLTWKKSEDPDFLVVGHSSEHFPVRRDCDGDRVRLVLDELEQVGVHFWAEHYLPLGELVVAFQTRPEGEQYHN